MALVPILDLPPIDALPPSSLASEADLILLLHGSSPQSCQVRKGKSICSEEGGCESQGGEKCVMSKMKQSWLEKGLPLKEPDSSIVRVISKVKEKFKKLRKNEKTMGEEAKQRHSAALKAVTVNLAPVNYQQVILSRWELPAVAKKSLIAVLDDYVGKSATRFDFYSVTAVALSQSLVIFRSLQINTAPEWVSPSKKKQDESENPRKRGRPRSTSSPQRLRQKQRQVDDNENEEVVETEESEHSDFENDLRRKALRKTVENGGGGDESDEFVEAKIPKDILAKILPLAIKEGLSVRQAVMMVSGFLVGCELNLEDFIISTTTCQRALTDHCGAIGSEALDKYVKEVKDKDLKVFCHFDGKIIEEDFEGKRQNQHRLIYLISSPSLGREQLLGVAPLEKESGYSIALEVYNQLLGQECDSQVAGVVFDSTAVNTGGEEGAGIHLQRLLDRPILVEECGHHVQVRQK